MNCAKCGSILPTNAMYCPICNEPVAAAQGYVYPQPDATQGGQLPSAAGYGGYPPQYPPQQSYGAQGYPPQQGGAYPQQPDGGAYGQSYAQYGVGAYPPGYQPPYQYGQPDASAASRAMAALAAIPKTFVDSLTKPAEVLRRQMESRDRLIGPSAAALVLLLSFLCGMALVRGLVGAFMGGFSSFTGVSLAGDAASLNQGVSYISGRIAASVGGIAVLCTLIGMLVHAAVTMSYLCVIRKARFSLELLLGYVSVVALPHAAFLLLTILISFASPWPALLPLACSWAVGLAQMGSIMAFVTGSSEEQLFHARLACYSVCIAVTIIIAGVVGGALMGGVADRVLALLANAGSLI